MGYRIRMAAEVVTWLERLRETEPVTADLVDEALGLLRDQGPGLGPPLVVPLDVEVPAGKTYLGLDEAYQRQLQMLAKVRRGVADLATTGRRLDLRADELEQEFTRLQEQRQKAREMGRADLADAVAGRLSDAASRLAALREQRANAQAQEDRLNVASRRLQDKINSFRSRKDALKAGAPADLPGQPFAPRPLLLTELRPGAPGPIHARILFTVEPPAIGGPSSGTAVLLAAGTPRDQLDAWYAVAIRRCRDRYERDRGDTD
jgi:hypothetical protein